MCFYTARARYRVYTSYRCWCRETYGNTSTVDVKANENSVYPIYFCCKAICTEFLIDLVTHKEAYDYSLQIKRI